MRNSWSTRFVVFVLLVAAAAAVGGEPTYRTPPQVMVELVDAPPTPSVSLSPDGRWLLVMERHSLPSITELAEPELRLAGLRINPRRNGPSRARFFRGLGLISVSDGKRVEVEGLPAEPRIEDVLWSPDSRYVAFSVAASHETQLWVLERATAHARRIQRISLNVVTGRRPFSWVSDRHELLCLTVPAGRSQPPQPSNVPKGPVIQETSEEKAPARTYQDLLKNAHDEALFAYYMQSKISLVSLDGDRQAIGEPAMIYEAAPSPDGEFLLVSTITRPFSRLVPVRSFGHVVEVWKRDGTLVRQLADQPPAEHVPIGNDAAPTGPRDFVWRADADATVYWIEARDGGDPEKDANVRDEVLTLAAPFSAEPQPLLELGYRLAGIRWGDGELALASERWWKTRRERVWLLQPDAAEVEPRLVFDRSSEDRYKDPGDPQMRRDARGEYVLHQAEPEGLFYVGRGASPEGDRPFIEIRNPNTRESQRLFRSEPPYYEEPIAVLGREGEVIVTRRESQGEPPNYCVRDLARGSIRQLTDFPHPSPQLRGVTKELIRYQRDDGIDLTATLYLPPRYSPEDGPLPTLMWAYPREYKDPDAASQVVGSPYQFVRVSTHSPLFWLTQGYAVLDGPTMPIVGEGKQEPNDRYVEQLVGSAKAAVEEVVRRGVVDRGRIAIGGHSYGAFMTANLLAHSDLFAAGIAQSGAYNRSLTPFGFQAEERTFWEAPEIYFAMSPFMHAQKVNEPILLIHGSADNNAGTFPIQSERFYHALKGHGATARLVMLPYESHGYRARESVLHMLWEKTEWLTEYVKQREVLDSAGGG